jgi:hypothetical protein
MSDGILESLTLQMSRIADALERLCNSQQPAPAAVQPAPAPVAAQPVAPVVQPAPAPIAPQPAPAVQLPQLNVIEVNKELVAISQALGSDGPARLMGLLRARQIPGLGQANNEQLHAILADARALLPMQQAA